MANPLMPGVTFLAVACLTLRAKLPYPLHLNPHRYDSRSQRASISSIVRVVRLFPCQTSPSCITQILISTL